MSGQSDRAALTREPVKLSWWHAGGLHAHVTYPDGSTLHRVWKADHYWELDSLRLDLEREFGKVNVQVTP